MNEVSALRLREGRYYMAYSTARIRSAKILGKRLYIFRMGPYYDAVAVDYAVKMGWNYTNLGTARSVDPARNILSFMSKGLSYFEISEEMYLLHIVTEVI